MKKFLVERKLPGAGILTAEELKDISRKSVAVMNAMGKPYVWMESYITDDAIYCVHEAESEAVVREHAKICDFPINLVQEIKTVIGPATAK